MIRLLSALLTVLLIVTIASTHPLRGDNLNCNTRSVLARDRFESDHLHQQAEDHEEVWDVLFCLAALEDHNLRFRLVQEARRTPPELDPDPHHPELGLNALRRDRLERQLVKHLTAKGVRPEVQRQLALALAGLGNVSPQSAGRAVTALGKTMLATGDAHGGPAVLALAPYLDQEDARKAATIFVQLMGRAHTVQYLIALAPRLKPTDAALLCGFAATLLSNDIYRGKTGDDLRDVAQQFSVASLRLERKIPVVSVVSAQTAALLEESARHSSRFILDGMGQELAALAPFLDAADARRVAKALSHAMTEDLHPVLLLEAARALESVLARLDSKEAADRAHRAVVTLKRAMAKTKDSDRRLLAQGVAAVATRLEPRESEETFYLVLSKLQDRGDYYWITPYLTAWAARQSPREGAAFLIRAMSKTDPEAFYEWSNGVQKALARLDSQEARGIALTFVRALGKPDNQSLARSFSQPFLLESLAARLDSAGAKETIAVLLAAMGPNTDTVTLNFLSGMVYEFAGGLDPVDAADAATTLARLLTDTKESDRSQALALALLAVGRRQPPATGVATFRRALHGTTDLETLRSLAYGLAEVAPRHNPKEAAAILTDAMNKITDRSARRNLVNGLVRTAVQLPPSEGAAILASAMNKSNNSEELEILAHHLSTATASLEEKASHAFCAEIAVMLGQAMSRTDDPFTLSPLADSLAAVAARLEAKDAAAHCSKAATILHNAMLQAAKIPASPSRHSSISCEELRALAQGLAAVATRLERKDAAARCAQAATLLHNYMTNPRRNSHYYRELNEGLRVVALHLDPKAAKGMATALTQTMKMTTDTAELDSMTECLAVVATRMDGREAIALLLQAITVAKGHHTPRQLAGGIVAVAARQSPKKGAATLTQAMNRTTETNALQTLAYGLSATTRRMDTKEAVAVSVSGIEPLLLALSNMPKVDEAAPQMSALLAALSAVLHRETSEHRHQRAESLTTFVGICASVSAFSLAPTLQAPAFAPMPEPWPAQALVDLLKHPLCVGEARRIVLDALGHRYQRTFADHWDFVRFAEQQKLGLDLTNPPKRP